MVGGMVSSTVLTLVVIPAVYSLWKERAVIRLRASRDTAFTGAPRGAGASWPACPGDRRADGSSVSDGSGQVAMTRVENPSRDATMSDVHALPTVVIGVIVLDRADGLLLQLAPVRLRRESSVPSCLL